MKGRVYLVGAGPGDPELLTLRALRLLESADVVLHDDLVTPEILAKAASATQVLNVGKRCGRKAFTQDEINALMISYARDGHAVVRLQGGDPLILGRAGEEIAALRDAEIEFEIVPGVTSALGAAAGAQVSLTERGVASSVILTTGHGSKETNDWAAKERRGTLRPTVVVYMPSDYARISQELREAGWENETPCLVVSGAATAQETSFLTTLAALPQAPRLPSPKLLIIGAVLKTALPRETPAFAEETVSTANKLMGQISDLTS